MKLVYMGTAAFAVPTLAELFHHGFSILGVVTQPDKPSGRGQSMQAPPVKTKALELGLPVYQPATLRDENSRNLFAELDADMIVVVAYGKILPPWLLRLPQFGAVNLHGSLLPRYRGAAPIHWAVVNGEPESGVCTMQVDDGLDTGPVYLCERTPIDPDETVPHLSNRLATIGAALALRTINGILDGTLKPQPQDPAKATLAPILKKSDGFINWGDAAVRIHNQVRAFNPWPGTVTRFRGSICKILKTKLATRVDGESLAPGSLSVDRHLLRASCGDNAMLEILELQPENRKPVSGGDFANGARIQAGEKFEPVADNGSNSK